MQNFWLNRAELFRLTNQFTTTGRGRKVTSHKGNQRLRSLIQRELKAYQEADKTDKSYIILSVVRHLEKRSQDGVAFVKFNRSSMRWYAVPPAASRVNVAQAFRDSLSPRYRSSKYSKQRRRFNQKGLMKATGSSEVVRVSPISESSPITLVSACRSALPVMNYDPFRPSAYDTLMALRRKHLVPASTEPHPDRLRNCSSEVLEAGQQQDRLTDCTMKARLSELFTAPLPQDEEDRNMFLSEDKYQQFPLRDYDAFDASAQTSTCFMQQILEDNYIQSDELMPHL